MGLFELLELNLCLVVLAFILAESAIFVRLDRAPLGRTRFSTAVFRYSFIDLDGQNPCLKYECSLHCELDNHSLKSCPPYSIIFKNLAQNRNHKFLLNVTTSAGERNSSAYNWYIDTEPPTASIFSEKNFTNAANVTIGITFSEACTGLGGFKCVNASICDVIVNGPATVDPSTLKMVEKDIKYSLVINLSMSSAYGRVVVKMAQNFCTDQAGNMFRRMNSSIVIHFDRRPVLVDLWTSVPSYELEISRVPRTVLATNRAEDMKIFLEFSDSLLKNVSRTKIITVKLQSTSLIGRSGTAVSPVVPIIFLYDSTNPSVKLCTSSPRVTKEATISVVVEFTKPVFGFDALAVEVGGGRLARFKEHSKALYSLTIILMSQNVVSVLVPEGKASDVSGNLNSASNQLEVRHYSTPAVSVVLHSFVTAGLFATSLAAAILALSSTNLAAIGGLTSGATTVAIADPSRNLLGTVGHMQVFVFSDWLSSSLPIEYSETTKGLRWLIPSGKLPWKKEEMSMWPHYPSNEFPSKISIEYGGSNSSCIASLLQQKMLSPTEVAISSPVFPKNYGNQRWSNQILTASFHDTCRPNMGRPEQTVRIKSIPYGLPLDSSEYFIYFLRGEPLSIDKVVNRMENYTGWDDFGMNMFWLGVVAVGMLAMHLLILIFLRWRTGTLVHGLLSFPRFELFLLILMLPCMSQSSAFVIRGGTTGGIIAGSLLLAVPTALLLSVSLFLVVAVFMGSFVQYKEVKKENSNDPWHSKLLNFFIGWPTTGKWFDLDHLPTSFLSRFGILFQDRKGPPIYLLVDRNDPVSLPEWIESSQSGIKRMQAVSLSDSNEDTKIHTSDRILGCARAAYLILDLLRRVGLAIISGSCSLNENSQKQIQCLLLLALGVTLVQFLYLFFLKPYIRRGVHVAESVSLLCELGIFGLSFYMENRHKFNNQRHIGSVMIALLFISFVCHLVNEWYALIKGLLRLPQPQNQSFKRGIKWAAKGLILPFLPRKHWSRLVPGWAQPKTGLIPVVPARPETELERQDNRGPRVNPLNSMTATVVPIYSPDMPGLTDPILPSTSQQHETEMNATSSSQSGQALNQRSQTKIGEGKRHKGLKSDVKNEIKMLQEMAKASFLAARKIEEGSTSYTPREKHQLDQPSPDDSKT